jgi:hypothetical protein
MCASSVEPFLCREGVEVRGADGDEVFPALADNRDELLDFIAI